MQHGHWATLSLTFDDALAKLPQALAAEGFGVITQIDMQATLRAKLGLETGRYNILGACNPGLAHKAVSFDPTVGLLLPCNVVLFETPAGEVRMGVIDPMNTLGADGGPELQAVAAEVGGRLGRVLAAMQ
jgi:uncharacterized protein (DUF302 family)